VYRATYCPQGGFHKTVAIKRVLPKLSSNPEFTELFLEEAGLCALLAHPNIVQVFDCGRFQNTFILAMEYVDGASLHRLIRKGNGLLPISAVTFLGAELAAGLDYVHRRMGPDGQPLNLVHRDVNPPNILISRWGEVKLADFGVARAATRVKASLPGFYGKTCYAAPEQLKGLSFDGRADLFALGLTLYEALTGEPVLTVEHEAGLRNGVLPLIPPPSRQRPDVPPGLDRVVMALLAAEPVLRPVSGAEVRRRLTELTGEAAPFPQGQKALAAAVEAVRARAPSSSSEPELPADAAAATTRAVRPPEDVGTPEATRALRVRR
jgi:serine/threonine-protein kinase